MAAPWVEKVVEAPPTPPWAPIWRRWLAALYDSLLLAGVALGVGFLVVVPASALGMPDADLAVLLRVLLLALIALYFATFWRHAQRTPGMRAWHLILMIEHGRPGWVRSISRTAWMLALLLVALILYGLLGGVTGAVVAIALVLGNNLVGGMDPQRRSLVDVLAGTHMLLLSGRGAAPTAPARPAAASAPSPTAPHSSHRSRPD